MWCMAILNQAKNKNTPSKLMCGGESLRTRSLSFGDCDKSNTSAARGKSHMKEEALREKRTKISLLHRFTH